MNLDTFQRLHNNMLTLVLFFCNLEENIVYAVLNGGYFNMQLNISASFVAENGQVLNKNDINQNQKNHPTVGAFGLTKQGTFQT